MWCAWFEYLTFSAIAPRSSTICLHRPTSALFTASKSEVIYCSNTSLFLCKRELTHAETRSATCSRLRRVLRLSLVVVAALAGPLHKVMYLSFYLSIYPCLNLHEKHNPLSPTCLLLRRLLISD
jgi:hypothetical protein